MTPQFLREEAARFRGMAETVEREASKVRLLKMATDYEARAAAAGGPAAVSEAVEPVAEPVEPVEATGGETLKLSVSETTRLRAPRRISREPKETA
jgi:hypothetical protein